MSETFKIDETVTIGASIVKYRVESGPYLGPGGTAFYVVSDPARTVFRTAYADAMHRPTPVFEAGGTVKIDGGTHTLLAGPFDNGTGYTWWAIQDASGAQLSDGQHVMTDYQPPAPAPETFEYAGVAYEVGATYKDREGDRWTLEELPVDASQSYVWRLNGRTMAWESTALLVERYGPLVKVEA
ncbi:phiSA1p31-related protein [Streptomyces sp. 6N106]|uniref:phiSA1p31-related protein n=1 Tax=Streptomyces sp. 6N106 TaxID=3457418 RepID=UPI003FCF3DB2